MLAGEVSACWMLTFLILVPLAKKGRTVTWGGSGAGGGVLCVSAARC